MSADPYAKYADKGADPYAKYADAAPQPTPRDQLPADYEERKAKVRGENTASDKAGEVSRAVAGSAPAVAASLGVTEMLPVVGPLAKYGAAKLSGNEQQAAQTIDSVEAQNPISHGVGMAAGVGAGIALSGGAGAAAQLGTAANIGLGAAEGAATVAAYTGGEILHQDQIAAKPATVEQLSQMFDPETLGWGALAGGALAGAGQLLKAGRQALAGAAEGAAEKAATNVVKDASQSKAGAKALGKIHMQPDEIVGKMRESDVFDRSVAAKRMEEAGEKLGDYTARLLHGPEQAQMLQNMNVVLQASAKSLTLPGETAGVKLLENHLAELGTINPETGGIAASPDKFYRAAKLMLQDAKGMGYNEAEPLYHARQVILDGLEAMNSAQFPNDAGAFKAANQDYRLFFNLEKALPNDTKQVTGSDFVKAGAKFAGARALDAAVPGFGHTAEVLSAGLSARQLSTKSFARVLNNLAQGPGAQFAAKTQAFVERFIKPGAMAASGNLLANLKGKDLDIAYDKATGALKAVQADPQAHAEAVQNTMSDANMPSMLGDAVTNHHVQLAQTLYQDMPKSNAPQSVFGAENLGITEQQKRDFLRKMVCAKDPHAAMATGNSALIAYSSKFNPDSIQTIRAELFNRLQDTSGKVPFKVKLQLAGCLGVALPSQDPVIGAGLRNSIKAENFKNTQQGQASSAKQNKMLSAQQKGMATKVQKLAAEQDTEGQE